MDTPPALIGVGVGIGEPLAARHRSRPVRGSYPRAKFAPFATSSAPFAVVTTVGAAPRRALVADRFPHLRAGLNRQRDQERIVLRVHLDDHQAVPDHRRARRSPLDGRGFHAARVHAAEIHFPQRRAIDGVGVEPLGPERGDDDPAVRRRSRARVSGFHMTLVARWSFVGGLLPDDLAACGIKRIQHPLVRRGVIRRIAAVVRAGLEGCTGAAADRACHEQSIAPDDRTRVASPGMFVRHRMFSPFSAFQLSGNCCPSATPAACGPRNDGQLPERSPARGSRTAASNIVRVTVRGGTRFGSPGGAHRVLSRNIARGDAGVAEHREAELFAVHLESILACGAQPSSGTAIAFNISAPTTIS